MPSSQGKCRRSTRARAAIGRERPLRRRPRHGAPHQIERWIPLDLLDQSGVALSLSSSLSTIASTPRARNTLASHSPHGPRGSPGEYAGDRIQSGRTTEVIVSACIGVVGCAGPTSRSPVA